MVLTISKCASSSVPIGESQWHTKKKTWPHMKVTGERGTDMGDYKIRTAAVFISSSDTKRFCPKKKPADRQGNPSSLINIYEGRSDNEG